LKIGQLSTEW